MKYILLTLLIPIALMACPPPYSQVNVCELMPQATKEAQVIWDKTKDSDAAMEKLQQAGMVQIVMYGRHKKRLPECKTLETELILEQYRTYLLDAIVKHGMNSEYRHDLERINQAIPTKEALAAQIYSAESSPYQKESFIKAYTTYVELLKKEGMEPKITPELKENLIAFGLIPAENRWANLLGSAADVPKKGFTRIQFDIDNPSDIYEKTTTPYIAMNSKMTNTSVFWSGRIDLDEETTLVLKMPPTQSKYRVIIDGYVAVKVDSYMVTDMLPLQQKLAKGTHIIEVELSTGSRPNDFALTITPETKRVHGSEFNNKLREIGAENAEVWMVSLYSVQTIENKMLVKLKPSKKPVILLLGSYSPINWVVDTGNTNLKAVFYSATMSPGTVMSANDKKFPVYLSGQLTNSSLEPGNSTPQCINGIYSFSPYRSIMRSIDHLNNSYGITLRAIGYPVKSQADSVTVPTRVLDDAEYARMRQKAEEEDRESKKCVRTW